MLADLAKRDLQTRFAGSHFGILWAFIVPLFSSLVFILVFRLLLKGGMLGTVYARFDFTTLYFLGFAPWILFSDVVARATSVVRENRNLVRNVRMDLRLLPPSQLLTSCLAHAVVVGLCYVLVFFNDYPLSHASWLLPIAFILLCVFSLGLAYFVAALSVYFADLAHGIPIILSLWFFCTPILYTPQLIEESGSLIAKTLLLDANPMTHFVEAYRRAIVRVDAPFDQFGFMMMCAFALGSFIIGYFTYRRLQKGFADVL